MVETKYIKIGIAATAAVALTIGLGVGLSSNKAGRNVSSSQATGNMWEIDSCLPHGKSGKSGGSGSGKSGKSGGNMSMDSSGKSGKSGGKGMSIDPVKRRSLVVPGTEEYHQELAGSDLERRLGSKSAKSGCGSGKSGKSSGPCPTRDPTRAPTSVPTTSRPTPGMTTCAPTVPGICTAKSGKSGGKGDMSMGSSGKSGKSGNMSIDSSGKSGKSGGSKGSNTMSMGKSGKSGGKGDMSMGCGKSGKSGGKSGGDDDGDDSGCGDGSGSRSKSDKSSSSTSSPAPTICSSAKSSKSTSTKSSKPPTSKSSTKKPKSSKGAPAPPTPPPTPGPIPPPTPPPTPGPTPPPTPPPTPGPTPPPTPPPTPGPTPPLTPPPTKPPTLGTPSPGAPCSCSGGAETAYANAYKISEVSDKCFLEIENPPDSKDVKGGKWGWSIGPLTSGTTETFPIFAGAASCDTTKGPGDVGDLTVNYDGQRVLVTFTMTSLMKETQVYVGSDLLPDDGTDFITSPGQYGNIHDPLMTGPSCNSDSYTITNEWNGASLNDQDIYIVAHTSVCDSTTPEIGTQVPTMQGTTTVATDKESGEDSQAGAPRPAPAADQTTGEGLF